MPPITTSSSPKHQQILASMHDRIRNGKYKPGGRMPTDAELVKEFGVSRPTVARALRELERRGLVIRRPGSGTYVREEDRKGLQFGVVIAGLGLTEIFEPICASIATAAQDQRHSLLWGAGSFDDVAGRDDAAAVQRVCEQFVDNKVAGVFFAPFVAADDAADLNKLVLETLAAANIAVVLLDRDYTVYPDRGDYDLVGIDNRRAGFMLTNHLVEQGCKRLVFVAHPYMTSTIAARVEGFRAAHDRHRLSLDEQSVLYCDPTDESLIRGVIADRRPDGFVCGNDVTAGQLMHSLDDLGIGVPDDVLVTGMDDVKYAELMKTPLTSVRQPCAAIGRAAFMAMMERIEWRDAPPREILLRCDINYRASSMGRE